MNAKVFNFSAKGGGGGGVREVPVCMGNMVLAAKTWLKVSFNFIYVDKPLKHDCFY